MSQLHTEVQGNCSKVKDAEIIKYTDSILDAVKSVLKDKDDKDDEGLGLIFISFLQLKIITP